jgi:hypothetical protein
LQNPKKAAGRHPESTENVKSSKRLSLNARMYRGICLLG